MTDDQPDLFGEPERLPYVRGSKTSLEAAIQAEPRAGTQRWRVLDVLRKYPLGLTDHQLQDFLNMDPSTERPRRIELVEQRFVIDSGRTRKTPKGRDAVVWIAVT